MPDQGPPPNLYQSMATMPGPMPPKKNDNDEELMKGFHGVFKAMSKMEGMNPGLSKDFADAKKAMKNAFANVLKGDPSSLDDTGDKPPAGDPNQPPASPPPAPAPTDAPPPVPA